MKIKLKRGVVLPNKVTYSGGHSSINSVENPYEMKVNGKSHDIKWLL